MMQSKPQIILVESTMLVSAEFTQRITVPNRRQWPQPVAGRAPRLRIFNADGLGNILQFANGTFVQIGPLEKLELLPTPSGFDVRISNARMGFFQKLWHGLVNRQWHESPSKPYLPCASSLTLESSCKSTMPTSSKFQLHLSKRSSRSSRRLATLSSPLAIPLESPGDSPPAPAPGETAQSALGQREQQPEHPSKGA